MKDERYSSYTLAVAVQERMKDYPSHTMVDLETIMEHVMEVLDGWGFLTIVKEDDDD